MASRIRRRMSALLPLSSIWLSAVVSYSNSIFALRNFEIESAIPCRAQIRLICTNIRCNNVAVTGVALRAAISVQISTILLSTTAPLLLLPLLADVAVDSRENFEEDVWARRILLQRRLRARSILLLTLSQIERPMRRMRRMHARTAYAAEGARARLEFADLGVTELSVLCNFLPHKKALQNSSTSN